MSSRPAIVFRSVIIAILALLGGLVDAGRAAVPLAPSFTVDGLDLANTIAGVAGQERPLDLPTLISVLGLHESAIVGQWRGAQSEAGRKLSPVRYRVSFKKPITIGSLLAFGNPRDIAVLKPDAPYPGDMDQADQWQSLDVMPRQSSGFTAVLERAVATRAVLLVDRSGQTRSELRALRIWSDRRANVTPLAMAYAEREYHKPSGNFSRPFTYRAANVTTGSSAWVSAGADTDGRITVPPISDVAPTWFMLAWNEPRTIRGLWIDGNLTRYELDSFHGPEGINPRVGAASEWRALSNVRRLEKHGTWLEFPSVTTRGLRIRITKTSDSQVAEIRGLHTFIDLGDAAPPAVAATPKSNDVDLADAPKQVSIEMPYNGKLTLVMNDLEGRRVRNVVGRATLDAGQRAIGWNLQDEAGRYVAPGKYRWKAIAHPPLELKYEQTVYPNVSAFAPGNAPWQTRHDGSDGWLADHTAPICGCALGDKMYLGAPTAESGVSLLECDLDGRKTWGHHSFAAWTGPRFLTGDGSTLFVGARMNNNTTDAVWAVDTSTRKVTPLLNLTASGLSKRGLQGMAARDGTLVLSVRGDPSMLAGAASAADVDLMNCQPTYAPQRKATKGLSADRRGDFLRLCRLQGTPPGSATRESLAYLETEKSSHDQQHLLVSFARPIPLGSVVLGALPTNGVALRLSVLKPGAPYPPNVEDGSQWLALPEPKTPYWDVVPAPVGTETRALRITFSRGTAVSDGDDPLGKLLEQGSRRDVPRDPLDSPPPSKPEGLLRVAAAEWQGKLEGLKLLRRRFENLLPSAKVRFNSGRLKGSTWDAERTEPLTTTNPGIYALEWEKSRSLTGLAIREIDGKLTKIDVYEGPANGPIDIAADVGWREVATYEQPRRYWYQPSPDRNIDARYLDGYIDFGGPIETRAVRLRIVEQWADTGAGRPSGAREDQGGLSIEPARCRVYGVVPLAYLGGEAPVENAVSERLEIYSAADGTFQKQLSIARPGAVAYNPHGVLYAISGSNIVRVDHHGGEVVPFLTNLRRPIDFTFDAAGKLYVFEAGDNESAGGIFVYDASGKRVATIGEGAGFAAGPWNPRRLGAVSDLEIDSRGQLWAVESQFYPKRVTVWNTDGTFVREHFGNTEYGGGGVLDPRDKSRLFVGPLEFELDWKSGTSRLKNLTWIGKSPAGEVPIRIGERLYLVTRPRFADMPCGIVYLYENGRLKMVAAAGQAAAFDPLKRPEIVAKFGNRSLPEHRFHWTDRNGDGECQAEEVALTADPKPQPVTNFGPDLGLQAGKVRYTVREFLPNGAPVFTEEAYPALVGPALFRLSSGDFYRFGDSNLSEAVLTSAGMPLWTHACVGRGVQSLYSAANWAPDQVVSQFGLVGRLGPEGSPIGEMLVVHSNSGGWNVWTPDGLLIGPIFHDQRDGVARPWSMREHDRGRILENLFPGQEHFHGYACLSEDGKYRVVAGHNHVSVLEVLGLDRAVRFEGEIDVTVEDLRRTRDWAQAQQRDEVFVRAPVIECYRSRTPPTIDGALGDWQGDANARIGDERGPTADFRMSYDDKMLYLAYDVKGYGPLNNSGGEFQRLFKSGASVDLQIGVDPAALANRENPVEGDSRLLLTFVGGKPRAVLYRPTVPGTPEVSAYKIVSPVGEASFDRIEELSTVRMARTGDANRYVVEAAVPLEAIGLKPASNSRLKLDWGFLVSGADGNEVLRRVYWSNQATNIVADAPSEARLHPHLWGHVLFQDKRKSAEDLLDAPDTPAAPKGLDDLLDAKRPALP